MLTALRAASIPLADVGALRAAVRRTTVVRAVLAAALVGFGLAALLLARDFSHRTGTPSPAESRGVIALDLSSSVGPTTYPQLREALRRIAARHGRFGIVLFSDTAYEAVPPGGQPTQLGALLRFFRRYAISGRPSQARNRLTEDPHYLETPWSVTFKGGTEISSGLRLAEQILRRERLHGGRVLLVSDLDDPALDVPRLTDTVLDYARHRIPLEVYDLDAGDADVAFYRQLLGRSVAPAGPVRARARVSASDPAVFIAVCAALIAIVAANELWCGRLGWRRPEGGIREQAA